MKTAKEFFEERHYQGYPQHELNHDSFRLDTLHKTMVEFAKDHVKAALKAAAENAKWTEKSYETRFGDDAHSKYDFVDTDYAGDPCTGYIVSVNKDSILNSYPDKIK